jgi:hypothetical protein
VRKRRSKPLVEPALNEWSFQQCPAEELSNCHTYEFNRSSDLIIETVERWRAGEIDAFTESLVMLFPFTSYWMLDSDWPEKPYLDIPEEERWRHIVKQQEVNCLADLVDPGTNLNMSGPSRIVSFYVPEGLSRFSLSRAIDDLLERRYGHLIRTQKGGWRPKRGRGCHTERCQAGLKALSALRLKRKGYSAHEAIELAKSLHVENYSNPQAFCKAAKRAQAEIDSRENSLRTYAAIKGKW